VSGDAYHAHAFQDRDDDFDRLVHGGPFWPYFQIKRDEAKFPDGPRRFINGSARWLHVGHWKPAVSLRREEAMQAEQLLASSGVTMAAGAMISLSFAVSPPLVLVPPRPPLVDASGNVTSQQHPTIETVGAAIADDFGRRWQVATDNLPPMAVRDPLQGLIGGLLPRAEDALQVTQAEPHNLAAAPEPEQQESTTEMPQESRTRPSDACARQGLRRINYTQNHHRYWRCAGRR
jgi:hypothetical protein